MTDSMDRFIMGTTRNQIEGVNRIVNRFLDEMDRSMGNQFSSLATAMDAVTQNQITAARQTGETISAAEGIIGNARTLQQMTDQILEKFDAYMTQINEVRARDEQFEQRAAGMMEQMQKQNAEIERLTGQLGEKIASLPDRSGAEGSLEEIRTLTAALSSNVKTISDTLVTLAEEV